MMIRVETELYVLEHHQIWSSKGITKVCLKLECADGSSVCFATIYHVAGRLHKEFISSNINS
jgi:hypothetical protein